MGKIEKALLKCEIKKTGENEYSFVMSDETIDRDGEIIKVDGWDIKNYKSNNILLWGHRHDIPGIGVVGKVLKEDGKLVAKKVRFASPGIYELADTIHGLVDDGVLKAVSVGYMPIEREYPEMDDGKKKKQPRVVTNKAELYELSIVNVGSNPNALMTVKSAEVKAQKGYTGDPAQYLTEYLSGEVKRVISYAGAHSGGTPKAPRDAEWDAAAEVSKADVDDLKIMCAWMDSENPDIKSSYKFPHHKASGQHAVVFRACAAAIAVLNGARGGANIPAADRKGVYNHVAKHIRDDFDAEPAPLKSIEEIENDPYNILLNEIGVLKNEIKSDIEELKEVLKENKTKWQSRLEGDKYYSILAVDDKTDSTSDKAAEKQNTSNKLGLLFKPPASLKLILKEGNEVNEDE